MQVDPAQVGYVLSAMLRLESIRLRGDLRQLDLSLSLSGLECSTCLALVRLQRHSGLSPSVEVADPRDCCASRTSDCRDGGCVSHGGTLLADDGITSAS